MGDAVRAPHVCRPHARRETVRNAVGQAQSLFFAAKAQDGHHRAEDFFLGDAVRGLHVGKDRGREKVPAVRAALTAGQQGGAVLLPQRDVVAHTLELLLRHQRAHACLGVERIAGAQVGDGGGEGFEEFVIEAVLHEDARARGAHLPLVVVNAGGGATHGALEVGVSEDDVGRLAAEFERDPLERVCRAAHDDLADRRGACEGDLVYARMRDQCSARCAKAGQHAEHAGREFELLEDARQGERRERRLLGRLEQHGIARSQRRRNLHRRHLQRKIPRNDGPDHAHGFEPRVVEVARRNRQHAARELAAPPCVVFKSAGRVRNVAMQRFAIGFAGVERLEPRQFLDLLANALGHAPQQPRPGGRRHLRPGAAGLQCLLCAAHGRIHVRRRSLRHAADRLALGGVFIVVIRALRRLHPAPTQKQLAAVRQRPLCTHFTSPVE